MATKKKMLQAAAGNAGGAGGAGLDVEEVFSTYLYTGNGSTQTVTNGIDLDGEGGLVWLKSRDLDRGHNLNDSERVGTGYKVLSSNSTAAEVDPGNRVTAFNSDGFTMSTSNAVNASSEGYASWTFRKAPKFFDVVTYTGDGTSNRQIAHNIGGTVGFILIKRYDSTGNWLAWHRQVDPGYGILDLTLAFEAGANGFLNDVTDTYFETSWLNTSGATYVAYLFAHNDGDGEFGPDGDADIIKCGSYTGNGSNDGPVIDLGFEPQWLLIKDATSSSWNWMMVDAMRGCPVDGPEEFLMANTAGASQTPSTITSINLTPTGFKIADDYGAYNTNGNNIIYIAIRRGTKVPESATEVFAIDTEGSSEPYYNSGFPVDFGLQKRHISSGSWYAMSRLTQGRTLKTESTAAEIAEGSAYFDYMNGFVSGAAYGSGNSYGWMWKRAPGFFDVVAYTGDGVAGRTVPHNLGVAPEMLLFKDRDIGIEWSVWHKDLNIANRLVLNTSAASSVGNLLNGVLPSSSVITLGADGSVNPNTYPVIAYLFASLDGISKVGSYTGNGSSQTIDCGFTSGARFILVKRTDSTGDWYVWDTERGIVAGNDPYLELNTQDAEVTSTDWVDPDNSGFIVNGTTINASSAEYIFYAIA